MTVERPGVHAIIVLFVALCLLGVVVTPISTAADSSDGLVHLTFETGADGESWEDPAETDFGYVDFSVYTPHNDRERSAVAQRVRTPDTPSSSRNVITNQNSRGEPGWLNLRFRDRQANPSLVLWLEPRDERIDETGNSNVLIVRGYDSSNNRVFTSRSQIIAGGYVFKEVQPPRSSDHVSRVAITVRPPSGSGFSRFYVPRVRFNAAPPEIDLSVSPARPESGERITVRANVETAGVITEYDWIVDGDPYTPSDDRSSSIRPRLGTGSHTVGVQVTDRLGLQGTASRTIVVQSPTPVTDPLPGGNDGVLLLAAVVVGVLVLMVLVVRRVRA